MKKLVLAITAILGAGQAAAETVTAIDSITSVCSFDSNVVGVLDIVGSGFSTPTPASISMTNNEPAGYSVQIGTGAMSVPAFYTGTTTFSKVNADADPTGGDAVNTMFAGPNDDSNTSAVAILAGTDLIEFYFNGTFSVPATAGNYTASTTVSCVAVGGEP